MAFVTLTRPEHGIAVVTLNRPERMNALSVALAEQLLATLEQVAADDSVGAVVLTGAGRGFCAGGDVKEMELNRDKSTDQRRADLAMMHRIPAVMAGMVPVVVAVSPDVSSVVVTVTPRSKSAAEFSAGVMVNPSS